MCLVVSSCGNSQRNLKAWMMQSFCEWIKSRIISAMTCLLSTRGNFAFPKTFSSTAFFLKSRRLFAKKVRNSTDRFIRRNFSIVCFLSMLSQCYISYQRIVNIQVRYTKNETINFTFACLRQPQKTNGSRHLSRAKTQWVNIPCKGRRRLPGRP